MRLHDEARREAEWRILHDRITETLDRFGKKRCIRKRRLLVGGRRFRFISPEARSPEFESTATAYH